MMKNYRAKNEDLYKNQYLIVSKKLSYAHDLKASSFGKLTVYSHPSLNLSSARNGSTEVLLLGYIINPLMPQDSDSDIIRNLAKIGSTKELFFREAQSFSGRFILIYKNTSDCVALTDACALKQLYYAFIDDETVLTSSPKMFLDFFDFDLVSSRLKQDFINLKEYSINECAWLGDNSIDDRLMKVLPNHYLDVANRKVQRLPIYGDEILREADILEYSCNILKGTFDAITGRYRLIQPLTAGWDTRMLLAASRDFTESIKYYVFDFANTDSRHPDVWVSRALAERLCLDFSIIRPMDLHGDFLTIFRREHVLPRILPETTFTQHHFYNSYTSDVINVSGNGAEIVRCFYGHTNRKIDANSLATFSRYPRKNKYVNQQIRLWLDDAEKYSAEYGIPMLDLFYWEQRMGNWAALYHFEEDIAINEFSPFNNKNLLLNMLKTRPQRRISPKYKFFDNLIRYLWKETLAEPINPAGIIGYVKKIIKGNSAPYYYALKAESSLEKLRKR
jgi:hypothetical protein